VHSCLFVDCCETTYSLKHVKSKLVDCNGNHIVFAEISGKKNIVCFQGMCSTVVSEKWHSDQVDSIADRSECVIRTAAKLIVSHIQETEYNISIYPSTADMTDSNVNFVPPLLNVFVSTITACKLKQSFIGQAVVQAAWLRSVISPLLLGLALDLDLQHSSQSLLDKMACLGACVSYEETNRYKQSTRLSEATGSAQ